MMPLLIVLEMPLRDPIPVFGILLFVTLIFPLIFKKLKIPGIVGLLLAGMLIGPHGVGLIERDASVKLLGTIGLVYIMFLASLELDIVQLRKKQIESITFGILTFIVPFSLGMIVSYYLLHFDIIASMLISLMFSTQTLISYPIASRLGITNNSSVIVSIGGTTITDTAVLIALGLIVSYSKGQLDGAYIFRLFLQVTVFFLTVSWIFPKLAKWYFKNIEEENYSQFVFVLTMILASAFLAELAGMEAIVGAFFAGLALNRLIPHSSALMARVHFAGNAMFIPFFLISVGMLVDLRLFFTGWNSIYISSVVVIVALTSKWIAAYITQIIFKFTNTERNIIFGLSASHAAATVAVILIGYNLGLLNLDILNSAIMVIFISCLVSSFVTENQGRKLAISERKKDDRIDKAPLRILLPCAKPESINKLLDFAVACKEPGKNEPIFPLSVIMDDGELDTNIATRNKMIESYAKQNFPNELRITPTSRVDTSPANGIIRAAKEMTTTLLVLGWSEDSRSSEFFFGSLIDHVLETLNQTTFLCRLTQPIHYSDIIHVIVPENSEYEIGFDHWVDILGQISKNAGIRVYFYGRHDTLNRVKYSAGKQNTLSDAAYTQITGLESYKDIVKTINTEDVLFIVHARNKSLSYSSFNEDLIDFAAINDKNMNLIIAYPEQSPLDDIDLMTRYEVLDASLIRENINVIQSIGRFFKSLGPNKKYFKDDESKRA